MRDNQFTINVKTLEKGPIVRHIDAAPGELDLVDEEFEFGQVTGEVHFKLISPRVLGRGMLETIAKAQCVRCLVEAEFPVRADVDLIYENEALIRNTRNEHIEAEDEIVVPFTGDVIQTENELREAVMLGLPARPLCSEDCQGLCPQCGKNLNEGACDCDKSALEISAWKSALQGIKLKSE